MLDVFRQEVDAQVVHLQQQWMALQQQPPSDTALQIAVRALQTIEGLARIVDIEPVVTLAQAIQSRLVMAHRGTGLPQAARDRLLQIITDLPEMSQLGETEQQTRLTEHLEAIATLADLSSPLHSPELPSVDSAEQSASESDGDSTQDLSLNSSLGSSQAAPAVRFSPPLVDAQMMELFRLEVEEQTRTLNEGLLALEAQPTQPQPLEALMRAAHSIKGAARIVGLDAAVNLAHVLEDCFVAAQNHTLYLTADLIDKLLLGVDLLQNLSQVGDRDLPTWMARNDAAIKAVQGMIQDSPQPFPEVSTTTASLPPRTVSAFELLPTAANAIAPVSVAPVHPQPSQAEPSALPALPQRSDDGQAAIALPPGETSAAQRVVRISAENLTRMTGLAGEALIEANALPTFADALMQVRTQQIELSSSLESLEQRVLSQLPQDQQTQDLLESVRRQEQRCRALLGDRLTELEEVIRRTTNLSDRLYREVIASHMRPFEEGVQNFSRMVRDLARSLNKQARVEIVGKSTSVDRDILTRLEAPLTHILRNAIDHGIESPEQRRAAGKPPEGRIRLEASHRGGMLSIMVSDDGAGIDLQRLQQQVLSRRLVTPEVAARLSEAEWLEFLFLPGFTLSPAVTELSGRGVGLDIVRSMAQEVGGSVRVTAQAGSGTSFHFQLPLTLSVVRTLLVDVVGEVYAFPLSRIDQILTIPQAEILTVESRQYVALGSQNLGLIPLYQVLDLPPPTSFADPLWVVVLSDLSASYGLIVDRCLGERELVVRPLDPRLGKVQDVSAAALMGDGSLVLILDVADLIQSFNGWFGQRRFAKIGETQANQNQDAKRILVVDDSITVREMERKLLQNHGYWVDVAVDGMEAWNAVRSSPYDLVISDIDMPRMNGIELIREMKRHSRFQSIPIIVVSYRDREDDRIQGLEAGADYYLTKSSFHDDTLIRAVTDLTGE